MALCKSMTPRQWDRLVDYLEHTHERDSVYLGTDEFGDPALLPFSVLFRGGHVTGAPGSGKTHVVFSPMIAQLIRKRRVSVVIFDQKGERESLLNPLLEAERAGIPARVFTPHAGLPSAAFNPFLQRCWRALSSAEWPDAWTTCMGLSYGDGYGMGHFTNANMDVLQAAFTVNPHCQSMHELLETLTSRRGVLRIDKKQRADGGDAVSSIRALAQVTALNCTPHNTRPEVLADAIDFANLFERPTVYYFYNSALHAPRLGSRISKLAFRLMLLAADLHEGPRVPVVAFTDEFQELLSAEVDVPKLLVMARSKGLSFVLANQLFAQLKNNQPDLSALVRGATAFHIDLTPMADITAREEHLSASGEVIETLIDIGEGADSKGKTSWTRNSRRFLTPALRLNDLRDVTYHENQYLLSIPQRDGLCQFGGRTRIVTAPYHISETEFQRRAGLPFTAGTPNFVMQAAGQAPVHNPDAPDDLTRRLPPGPSKLDDLWNRLGNAAGE